MSQELEENPLMCGDFVTKESQVEKWLGQLFSSAGLADSVAKTVAARVGKIKAAGLEITQIVNDWRAQAVGGMETALLLWESCCISSFLHGAGTWVEISGQTEKQLNSIQNWFIRMILQVGRGAPKASLLWDFGLLDMSLRVKIEKVMLVHHISALGENTLARKIYDEQIANKWPGLVQEADSICKELGVESVHRTSKSKVTYRQLILSAAHLKNQEIIKELSQGKSKCERIFRENYGKRDYVKLEQISRVRETYKARFGMNPFAGNFNSDRRFAKTEGLCRCQIVAEEESHLLSGNCQVFGTIREKYGDLHDDESLVSFFNEVLSRRDEIDEQAKVPSSSEMINDREE